MQNTIDSPVARQHAPAEVLVRHRIMPRRESTGAGRAAEASVFENRVWEQLFGTPRLAADEVAALATVARPRAVPPGEMVFAHDEAAHALVFVREGDVTLGHRAADGRLHVLRQVRGPAWLDQGSAWLGGVHGVDAWATTPSLVVEWPHDELQGLLRAHPGLCTRLLGSLSRELRQMVAQAHGLMHLDAPARFAQWLTDQVQTNGATAAVVRLVQRKRDIASQLAITPETLSRVMRQLSAKGLISVAGYNVHVHDLPALQQMAAAEG